MMTLANPWRVLDELGRLYRHTDNGPVWQPGGVPIWDQNGAQAWAEHIGGRAVPWPITGNA